MTLRRWLAGASAGTLLVVGGILAGPLGTFAKTPTTTPPIQQQAPAVAGATQVLQDLKPEASSETNAATTVDTDNVQAGGQHGGQFGDQHGSTSGVDTEQATPTN